MSHSNLETRTAKVEFVRRLAAKTVTVMLQETRAKDYDLRQVLRSLDASHWLLSSGSSDSVGGVAILVSRALSPSRPGIVEHSRGRVLEARTSSGGESVLSLLCVHNFGLGNTEARRFASAPRRLVEERGQAPLGRRAIFMGDLNFTAAQAGAAGAAKSRADRALATALERWVGMPVPGATHASPDGRSFSNIDRVWVLLPRSLLAVVRPRVGVRVGPRAWVERPLAGGERVAEQERATIREAAVAPGRHGGRDDEDGVSAAADLEDAPMYKKPICRWKARKLLLREAPRVVRDRKFLAGAAEASAEGSHELRLLTLARALRSCDDRCLSLSDGYLIPPSDGCDDTACSLR